MAKSRYQTVEIEVEADASGLRLDKYLRKLLPDMPLSHLHAMLRKGNVLGGGEKMKANSRVSGGEKIVLRLSPRDADALQAGRAAGPTAIGSARSLPVIFEDGDILAFDKPDGIAAHPGTGHPLEQTVLGALLSHAASESPTFKPSLVGRLDRDTSGVQLAGVSARGLRGLQQLSRSREIAKRYVAVVLGTSIPGQGQVDSPLIDRGSGPNRMRAVNGVGSGVGSGDEEAVEALTKYRVLARGTNATMVEVTPVTGRRHQIRSHMSSIGAPLAGDSRYGNQKWNSELKRQGILSRLFLHCEAASFVHPVADSEVSIVSRLPSELRAAADSLVHQRRK